MKKIDRLFARLSSIPMSALLVLVVLVPFCLIVSVIGWYSVQLLEDHTRFRMQEDIELVARAIRLPLSYAMERDQHEIVERALESAFTIDRVYGIYVYDHEGNTIFKGGAKGAEMEDTRAQEIANSKNNLGEFFDTDEEVIYSYNVPLIGRNGDLRGLLQVTRRGSDFDEYLTKVRSQSLAVIIVSIIAISLTIILGFRWMFGRHLTSIENSLARIKSEEIHHRLSLCGPREIRHLSSNINEMLDAVQQSQVELAVRNERETELKERLYQSEKLAAIGQLAAGIAHELGSPLSVVDGVAQRVLRQTDTSDEIKSCMTTIRHQSSRMEHAIRQLLDFGRTNPLTLRPMAAAQPLISALKIMQSEGLPHKAVESHISPEAKEVKIWVDPLRLEHALLNLLRNAFREAHSRVIVRCSMINKSVCYSVEDDGPGIDDALLPHLFEPFFTTKPTGQGTGLGLAVAHAAVSDHGGDIYLDTSDKQRTRFCIILPLGNDPKNG